MTLYMCSQPTDVNDPAGHSGAAPQDGAHTGIMVIHFLRKKKYFVIFGNESRFLKRKKERFDQVFIKVCLKELMISTDCC